MRRGVFNGSKEGYDKGFGDGLAGRLLTAVDSRTNPASTAGTAQHDLDLVSG